MVSAAYVGLECGKWVVEIERPCDVNYDSYTVAQLSNMQLEVIDAHVC